MPRHGFLENFAPINVWNPGVLATGSAYAGTAARWYQWAEASVVVMFFRLVTGAIDAKIRHEYSLDGVSYTTIKESDIWLPVAANIYQARIHRDRLPIEVTGELGISTVPRGALCRWTLVLANGTSVDQGSMEVWEKMIATPSAGQAFAANPDGRSQGIHYNEFDSARLQKDSNGVDRVRFDWTP